MSRKLNPARGTAKSARCPEGNPKLQKRTLGAVVMARVKKSLGDKKPAPTLALLTDQPLSICQKLLAGNRLPNAAMYEALFADDLIIDAILGLIPEDAAHPKVRAVRKAIRRLEIDFED